MSNKNKSSREKGFTLVELLAVIVILAIILVIAVPKIMDVINDAKKATLESTAKMIASQAEKQKVQNTVLGKEEEITCDSVAQINKTDYASCSIEFDDNTAKVTIEGSGKFEGLYVCNGTKTSAEAQSNECSMVCEKDEQLGIVSIKASEPYQVKDYDACMSYLRPIVIDDWNESEAYLNLICKNRIIDSYSFEYLVLDLLNAEYFTKEELISNNIVLSDSVWEQKITLGDANSCKNYVKDILINEWEYSEEDIEYSCNDEVEIQFLVEDLLYRKIFTPEELIENNVVGSDSVFTNIKPGTACVNKLKDIMVDEKGMPIEQLQTLCSGEDLEIYFSTEDINYMIDEGIFTEEELIENNVIKGSIEEACMPSYGEAVTFINKLYNDVNIREKIGLTKDNTADENIRYVGSNPRNYVYFNCEDTYDGKSYGSDGYNYASACETWRIIGIFNVKTNISDAKRTKRIKIVSNSFDGSTWDSSAETINGGHGINEWSQSDLKNILNGYYLGTQSTCVGFNDDNEDISSFDCTGMMTPLSSVSQNMIGQAVWSTRGIEDKSYTAREMYEAEQTSTLTGKECTIGERFCNDSVERKTEWEGKIGLIYPSDWGYASTNEECEDITDENETCKENNWFGDNSFWFWTISPNAHSEQAFRVFYTGGYVYAGDASDPGDGVEVRPSTYLKSDIEFIGGNGSENNPYILK